MKLKHLSFSLIGLLITAAVSLLLLGPALTGALALAYGLGWLAAVLDA